MPAPALSRSDRLIGLMLGTAVGDSVGLPAEGIGKRRNHRLFKHKWRQRFIAGRGMLSDDTEHTIFVSQCLLAQPRDPALFSRRLGKCLRWWLASFPAGTGLATLKASLRLWLGAGPEKSGVHSAGNGSAMRVAPIGAFFSTDTESRHAYTRASTIITHTDPRALTGSLAVADVIAWSMENAGAVRPENETFLSLLRQAGESDDTEWAEIVSRIKNALDAGLNVEEFAAQNGMEEGISGYIYHTVPLALYAWYAHYGDFRCTLESVLDCGGDTDTAGAITGALAGVVVGETGIPREWIDSITDWPRTIRLIREIGDRLAENSSKGVVRYFVPGALVRNIFFLLIVLIHGLRRLIPPY